jgi:hypothetical protein
MDRREVKNFKGYSVQEDGRVYGPRTELKPFMGRGGYLKVCLSEGDRRQWVYVHRLVCETFIDNPLCKPEVNHKDGCKMNNSKDNLEWVTRSENNKHAFNTGLRIGKRGESHYCHKLTRKQVTEIRELRGVYSQRALETMYGVSHSHISKIQRCVNWSAEVNHV